MSASARRGFGRKTTPTCSKDCARPGGRVNPARCSFRSERPSEPLQAFLAVAFVLEIGEHFLLLVAPVAGRTRRTHAVPSRTKLSALFRQDKLRDQSSIGQAALKVLQAQGEVVAFYYWLPPSVSKPSYREIDLLDYGQAASLKGAAHFRWAHQETRHLVIRPG